MNKITGAIKGLHTFLDEVRIELKKCAWPTRAELMESTVVVIVSVTILGFYVGISDFGVMGFLNLVIR